MQIQGSAGQIGNAECPLNLLIHLAQHHQDLRRIIPCISYDHVDGVDEKNLTIKVYPDGGHGITDSISGKVQDEFLEDLIGFINGNTMGTKYLWNRAKSREDLWFHYSHADMKDKRE